MLEQVMNQYNEAIMDTDRDKALLVVRDAQWLPDITAIKPKGDWNYSDDKISANTQEEGHE